MSFNWLLILNFVSIFCGLSVSASTVRTGNKAKENSGSYMIILNRIVTCKNPVIPFMKKPKAFLDISVKNNMVKGNFTIIGSSNNIQATMQDMYYIDGKWQTTFIAKNMSCRGKFMALLMDFIGVQYNKKTCAVPKGSYIFEFDYNKVDHIWMPLRDYGRTVRRLEAFSKAGSIACFEFEAEVKPANQ